MQDFQHPDNPGHLEARINEILAAADSQGRRIALPAREMYTGRQHTYVVQAVDQLRALLKDAAHVEFRIISAGYGLLAENDVIVPYEATFNGMRKADMHRYARSVLHLPQKVRDLVAQFDLAFFLLGESYLQVLDIEDLNPRPGLVFIAGQATRKWFPRRHSASLVCFTNDDVKLIGGGQVALKGAILRRLAARLAELDSVDQRLHVLHQLANNPGELRPLLRLPQQARLDLPAAQSTRKLPVLVIPRQPKAKNATPRPLFFVPDWDDLVNPAYDFAEDVHPQQQFDPYDHGVYAHELYDEPPYDGILVSRAVLDDSNVKKAAQFQDAHSFLRWPRHKPIMGDCGAFSYLKEPCPPYSTDDVLAYYERHGFDIGVSVDHLIVGEVAKDEAERKRRFRLTLDNAAEFIQKHRAGGYKFAPMGVAQGWDPASYEEAVKALLDMGYRHIAIGGLAFAKSQDVVDILARISPHFPEDLYVHIFGLAREELLEPYAYFGVTAFDSASFLRRSWMSARDNYLDPTTGQWFTAIRVPPSSFLVNGKRRYHREVKRLLERGEATLAEIERAEQTALAALRAYAQRQLSLEAAVQAVLEYDALVIPKGDFTDAYTRTLSERPWERCACPVCANLGVEVIIFRQNDRNRRRGFHNIYAFRSLADARLGVKQDRVGGGG